MRTFEMAWPGLAFVQLDARQQYNYSVSSFSAFFLSINLMSKYIYWLCGA
jgi:hypothetical protein